MSAGGPSADGSRVSELPVDGGFAQGLGVPAGPPATGTITAAT